MSQLSYRSYPLDLHISLLESQLSCSSYPLDLHISLLEKKPFLSPLRACQEARKAKVKSDAKTGEQIVFSEIHIIHMFEMP